MLTVSLFYSHQKTQYRLIKFFDDRKSHLYEFGIHLLSHIVSNIVPSAVQGLTVVFGMFTGVSRGRIDTEKSLSDSLPQNQRLNSTHNPYFLP